MIIAYDPAKNLINQDKHGIGLSQAALLEWDSAMVWDDLRFEYNEPRQCALALLGKRLFYVVFVDRNEGRRIISLRKANKREVTNYVSNH